MQVTASAVVNLCEYSFFLWTGVLPCVLGGCLVLLSTGNVEGENVTMTICILIYLLLTSSGFEWGSGWRTLLPWPNPPRSLHGGLFFLLSHRCRHRLCCLGKGTWTAETSVTVKTISKHSSLSAVFSIWCFTLIRILDLTITTCNTMLLNFIAALISALMTLPIHLWFYNLPLKVKGALSKLGSRKKRSSKKDKKEGQSAETERK